MSDTSKNSDLWGEIKSTRKKALRKLIFSDHARTRMAQRRIPLAEVAHAIEKGLTCFQNDTVRFSDIRDPFHGAVVIVSLRGLIVTVWRRGSKSCLKT